MDKKLRIGLVQTNTLIGRTLILPYAIGVLWSSAMTSSVNRSKWGLAHVCYMQEHLELEAQQLATCDLVCMSMYIWNFRWQIDLARAIKRVNPSCFVLMGGPFFTNNDQDYWQHYGDCTDMIFLGESDEPFRDFLETWPSAQYQTLPGAWLPGQPAADAPRMERLDLIPSPYLTGFYDDIMAREKQRGVSVQAILQTNRGCPYRCTFCEEGKEYKNKIFQADLDVIKAEIDWCGINQVEYVSLADDNWGIFERDLDITRHFCETKLRYGYPQVLDATFAKNAPDRVLAIAGIDKQHGTNLLRGITVSLQSTNQVTLGAIKRFNLVDEKQSRMIRELKRMDVPMYSEIIWPLPHETLESFASGLDSVIDSGITNWCAVYPISIYKSVDLYDDHINDYVFSDTVMDQHMRFQPQANLMPMASRWATADQVVDGHVIYNWLANLYYFGWARPALIYLKTQQSQTWTHSVQSFLAHLSGSHSEWGHRAQLFRQFWASWLQQQNPPQLNPDHWAGVEYWYTYTHLAHWISQDRAGFYQVLHDWLKTQVADDTAEQLTYLSQHNVVDHDCQYPKMLRDGTVLCLQPEQAQFTDPVESTTYYFWHRRKKGLNVIDVSHTREWQQLTAHQHDAQVDHKILVV